MSKLKIIFQSLQKKRTSQILLVSLLVLVAVFTTRTAVMTISNNYTQRNEPNEVEVKNNRRVSESTSKDGKKYLPIYSVATNEKKVAISFDAAWGADDTEKILKILEENNAPATFFLCGYWIDKYPEEVKKIYGAGHEIGNHGNTHAHSNLLSKEENKKEIMACHKKVKALLSVDINLFRPPFGEYNETVIRAGDELGYYTIQWNVDSHDWMNKGVDYEINQVLNNKNLSNGSIVLFHNDAKDTPAALPVILKCLKEKGYEIVPLSELIIKDNFYMDHEGRQRPN